MSSPLPSLISGITRSGRVTTPLGAASDKKPKSAGAHRETTRRNVNVRPASGKSDSHLQARIAGLKSLCACARFGVVDSLGRFCQEIRKKDRCTVCFSSKSVKKLETLPCQHKYCDHCFSRLALTAMANEQLFPPKCCSKVIPTKQVLSKLTAKEKDLFKLKKREYATPARERRYCPAMRCGKWIPREKLKSQSTTQLCPYCRTAICPGCRDKAHAPGKCSFDPELTEFLELARTQGWQRCFRCGAMVELHGGCQWITCRCGAEFCYKCGGPSLICHHNALVIGNVTAECQKGASLGDRLGTNDAARAIMAALRFAERGEE